MHRTVLSMCAWVESACRFRDACGLLSRCHCDRIAKRAVFGVTGGEAFGSCGSLESLVVNDVPLIGLLGVLVC